MDNEILKMFSTIMEQISDRNGCLTNLAKSRYQIMQKLGEMAMNSGNDSNGNWAKWNEMKSQLDKIDQLIRDISK